ncbi:MAG TPA: tyrosine recombinase XerC [Xanthomonadaceae bacterium]|nr:tyrosine recombinase XerC [Xanthomonadaceae bacterium]
MDEAPGALRAPVERFLERLEGIRRMSTHTVAAYRADLAALADWCDGLGLPRWRALHTEQLRAFIAAEHRRGLSPRSLQRRLSACRSFFRWLIGEGELAANPAQGLRAPKAPRTLPQVLDVDEAQRLVELRGEDPLGTRDRAMLELFYSSGLRLAELCNLHWRDLDLDQALVSVHGKGARMRIVPVGRFACEALQLWCRELGQAGPDAPVFPGRGGAPIAPRTVQARLRKLAQQQGIWKRVHPHLLRHSCASHLLESSGDLRGVQELLGHADIATTQIYTHLDYQHLARVYDGAHPRARRKRS